MPSNAPFDTTVSVIVPAYNSEAGIGKTIESLLRQTLPAEKLEIIVVNDGSTDNTLAICHEYANKVDNIVVIDQENGGVSRARNAGIDAARGAYIAFLDSDDTLDPDTLEAVADFFGEHCDEVDAVCYPMRLFDAKREWSHVREKVMTETGVYDLAKIQNAFALITNVNVMVKNNDELPRFREDLFVHEDEQFFITTLLKKQKVGFCKKGCYRYQQTPGSAVDTKMHPFYQFEQNIGFWEDLFAAYPGEAPLYLQASFLNEINWKIKKDYVFPYHYDEERFRAATARIAALMDRVDDDVIFTSPRADEHLRHFLLRLKTNPRLTCSIDKSGIALFDDKSALLCRNHVDVEFVWTRAEGKTLKMKGALKSVAFSYCAEPELFMLVDDANPQQVPLRHSQLNRTETHVEVGVFWGFDASIPLETCSSISFELIVDGIATPVHLSFSSRAQLDTHNGILAFCHDDRVISFDREKQSIEIRSGVSLVSKEALWMRNTMSVLRSNPKGFIVRSALKLHMKPKRPVWLYYDRAGSEGGNSSHQLLHDLQQHDEIDRFYVAKASDLANGALPDGLPKERVLAFDSAKHRFLHMQADRIIASYMEFSTWCPFSRKVMRGLCDVLQYDIVYLQHGVLHAHMPWKYSAERLLMEYEVISTRMEEAHLTSLYGFKPEQLIRSGMPRYDRIEASEPSDRKILFAPSWRKNLVAELPSTALGTKPEAFFASPFWRECEKLLSSERLWRLLNEHDYHLDIKLHPNFVGYAPMFERFSNDRIHVIDEARESDYRVFVTDYSSWVYDFVYLKRAIAYFLPDEDEFKSGLHGYHELDVPLEEGFGPLARTASELIDALDAIVEAGGQPTDMHRQRMEGFFLHYDNNQRARLYAALMEGFAQRSRP